SGLLAARQCRSPNRRQACSCGRQPASPSFEDSDGRYLRRGGPARPSASSFGAAATAGLRRSASRGAGWVGWTSRMLPGRCRLHCFQLPFDDFASNEITKIELPKAAKPPKVVYQELKSQISPESK